ncbi:hypothetical protein AVEN_138051-1 [Araneus ventricosus]|uniref:Uncharacterized protein n=1 Tax=Araneus ventricosus TaxID=182803 RepID=A0A4Y2SBH8_ARAVE|nr:hypothetical protein AVEN_138051-1 [Araneus ventricosus]
MKTQEVLSEDLDSRIQNMHEAIVTNMESRFPAMRVLWLRRELYKVKHGVTSATVMAPLTMATILTIWRPWRQIDDSRKCNPFLDISTRKGNTRENTM